MYNLFGVSRKITILIIGASLLLTAAMVFNIVKRKFNEKDYYQIISPNGDYHLTESYKKEGSCIYFTDEIGYENIVCGAYQIKKI